MQNGSATVTVKVKGYQRLYLSDIVSAPSLSGEITYLSMKNADIPVIGDDIVRNISLAGTLTTLTVTVPNPATHVGLYPKTWNNFDMGPGISLSSDRLTAYLTDPEDTDNTSIVKAAQAFSTVSMRYSEVEITADGDGPIAIGVCEDTAVNDITDMSDKWAYWSDGRIDDNGTITSGFPTYTTGDILRFIYDPESGGIWIEKNDVSIQGDPDTKSNPVFIINGQIISDKFKNTVLSFNPWGYYPLNSDLGIGTDISRQRKSCN